MITKTSLFNKGIYKSTLRRYLWGSVLYFVMLFLVTCMGILLSVDPTDTVSFLWRNDVPLILEDGFMVVPMLLAMVVPTVAGLLIFRFIHSRKTSVFVHSLPVKRTANYISSVLAGITLMAVPVIINTVLLILISLCGYGNFFTAGDCVVWMLLNLLCLFAMFSAVCLVGSITGNSFAMIALNLLIHTFVLIIGAGLVMVCEVFLYGFAGQNTFFDTVMENTFPVKLCEIMTKWTYSQGQWAEFGTSIIKIIIFAIVLYLLSLIFYKKRRMETAEEVAGFKCLNPIFKYLVTFIGALSTFSILATFIREKQPILWGVIILVSAVIYFGAEMLLRKSFKVWKSYKGYLIFLLAFALMMCGFAFTHFFGFETRLPDMENIQSAGVYNYYNGEKPLLDNDEVKSRTIHMHHQLLKEIPVIKDEDRYTNIHVEYTLKNGKTLHRAYPIDENELFRIMDDMYENEEYKKVSERIFTPMESLYRANIYSDHDSLEITDEKILNELIECIRKDIENLSYSEINSQGWGFSVEINYVSKNPLEGEYYTLQENNREKRISYLHIPVNSNYKNTMEWIKENGYWETVCIRSGKAYCVAKSWDELPGKNGESDGRILLVEDETDIEKITDFVYNSHQKYIPDKDRYYLYQVIDADTKDYRSITFMTKEELTELLPGYDLTEIE